MITAEIAHTLHEAGVSDEFAHLSAYAREMP